MLCTSKHILEVAGEMTEMNKKRNGFIDIMKLVFCLGVILNHLNTVSVSFQMNTIVMRYGFLGVEFFFIVSGYLMAKKANGVSLEHMRGSHAAAAAYQVRGGIPREYGRGRIADMEISWP